MLIAHGGCFREPDTETPVNFVCPVHGKIKTVYFGLSPHCPQCAIEQKKCMVCGKKFDNDSKIYFKTSL
jgi:hypothetical protein